MGLWLSCWHQVFVFCVWHAAAIQDYIMTSKWQSVMSIVCVQQTSCLSAGDALREIDARGLVSWYLRGFVTFLKSLVTDSQRPIHSNQWRCDQQYESEESNGYAHSAPQGRSQLCHDGRDETSADDHGTDAPCVF